jgi:hypothetical protein
LIRTPEQGCSNASGGEETNRGVVDPSPIAETRLGANLEAVIVPEDPDDRQYWMWDVDDLEDEPCP